MVVLLFLVNAAWAAPPEGGNVWAWGHNGYGQLGDGTNELANLAVQAGALTEVTAVSGGLAHSLALKADGTVWAWGNNSHGQLGDGSTTDSADPVRVVGLERVIGIAAGLEHSLALKSDGEIWAWGSNRFSQLGNGTSDNSPTPILVPGVSRMTSIATGDYRNLARRADGSLWSWGTPGLEGVSLDLGAMRPVAEQLSAPSGIMDVAVGIDHGMVLRDGQVLSWGLNRYGQLGDGSNETRPGSLVAVKNERGALKDVTAIAAGSYHGLALTSTGTVWSWGWNGAGQLGNYSTADSNLAVQVRNLKSVRAISAGPH